MSLSAKAIDRLFQRLAATYGASWTRQWADAPINDVKSAWAHELMGFANHLDAMAWALENLPARCPNVIEFKNLCRQAPAREVAALPEPKADPARLKAELAKLGEFKQSIVEKQNFDHKAWAKRIIASKDAGIRVRPICLRFAQEALA